MIDSTDFITSDVNLCFLSHYWFFFNFSVFGYCPWFQDPVGSWRMPRQRADSWAECQSGPSCRDTAYGAHSDQRTNFTVSRNFWLFFPRIFTWGKMSFIFLLKHSFSRIIGFVSLCPLIYDRMLLILTAWLTELISDWVLTLVICQMWSLWRFA